MADTSISIVQPLARTRTMVSEDRKIILACCVGTIFEWYDFFLYGALVTIIAANFFGQFDETTRSIFALLTFALGFIVRPVGALVFGRFGDLIGRKNIFLTTMILMGGATFAVGLLPTSNQVGLVAPIGLLSLRILQGLAISGEFSGAVIYVVERAPRGRRGFYAGWIPSCIGLSLLLALLVILLTQTAIGNAAFDDWGWRVPFLASAVLVALSIWIRLRLNESPAFLKMRDEGKNSRAPISEAFGRWSNARVALIALFGMTAGVAATGYAGTFYALVFMTSALKLDSYTANLTFAVAMLIGSCVCVFLGWLSDIVGRKPIILAGFLLAALSYITLFHELAETANPSLIKAQRSTAVLVRADPKTCSFLFNPTAFGAGSVDDLVKAIHIAGYPGAGDVETLRLGGLGDVFAPRSLKVIGLLLVLVVFAQMTQGPAASALVELFPTRIRYTSASLPYQIGTGWIGGLLPAIVFAMNAQAGDMFYGLWYPIAIAAVTFVIGLIFLPETKDIDIAN
jgi:Major Facilitator Superfamily/Sugar (and other) transporter